MKIKIVVIDPELSGRAKRILAAVIVPAIVLGGAAAAWAGTLHTWNTGDTLVAKDLNDNFATLKAGAPTGWSPYTCAVVDRSTGVPVGGDASKCVWRKTGTSIDVRIYSEFQSSEAESHAMSWALPPGTVIDSAGLPQSTDRSVLGSANYCGTPVASCTTNMGVVGPVPGQSRVQVYLPGATDALNTADTGVGPGAFVSLSFSVSVTP